MVSLMRGGSLFFTGSAMLCLSLAIVGKLRHAPLVTQLPVGHMNQLRRDMKSLMRDVADVGTANATSTSTVPSTTSNAGESIKRALGVAK